MDNKLEQLERRHKELEALLSDPEVLANQAKFRDYAREHRALGATISKYDELKSLRRQSPRLHLEVHPPI